MTTLGADPSREAEQPESPHQRVARLKAEAAALAVAMADLEAGRVIADGDLDAWLDAWADGQDMPLPDGPASPSRP